MKGVAHRLAVGSGLAVLMLGLLGGGAFAALCAPSEACPMMSLMASSHCGAGTSVTANCCASMAASVDPIEVPRSISVQSVRVQQETLEIDRPDYDSSSRPVSVAHSLPPPVGLYTLFSTWLI